MEKNFRGDATIADVAQHANVSISTVSRVINGLNRVHPQTRQRVMEAVEVLHYQPSAYARGLAMQRTRTLGFIISSISDPFYVEIVRGVEEAAASEQYNLLIASQPFNMESQRYLELFTQKRVDGMVLVGIKTRKEVLEHLQTRGFPVALVQQEGTENVATFLTDNYGGARRLTEHLLRLGYRHLAYIAGSNDTPDNLERFKGFRDALDHAGLAFNPNHFAQGDYYRGSGYRAMEELLERHPLPEAVFAANDQMALDAILVLRTRGIRVPDDLAVVGFDDIPMASYALPPLTTVRQPAYELGFKAAKEVLGALRERRTPQRVVLPTQLIVRASCGDRSA